MIEKMVRKTKTAEFARIERGKLYFEDCVQCDMTDDLFSQIIEDKNLKAIRLYSIDYNYFQEIWIEGDVWIKEEINMEMTLRQENRSGTIHWYAYRRVHTKLYKRYVGKSEDITPDRLIKVARNMPSL